MCVPTGAERRLIGRRDELVPDDPQPDLVRRAARRVSVAEHRARYVANATPTPADPTNARAVRISHFLEQNTRMSPPWAIRSFCVSTDSTPSAKAKS
jgi:hypothetical protein